MKIKTTNPNLREIKLPWMDEPVSFDATGVATVDDDSVGDRLVDEIDDLEEHSPTTDSDSDS